MAGLAILKPSGSVATRKFVNAMPCAVCLVAEVDVVVEPGAAGKERSMEVCSSVPVGGYFWTAARTEEGGLRSWTGTVW